MVIAFEKKINGKLFQNIRYIFIGWNMVYEPFHIDTEMKEEEKQCQKKTKTQLSSIENGVSEHLQATF